MPGTYSPLCRRSGTTSLSRELGRQREHSRKTQRQLEVAGDRQHTKPAGVTWQDGLPSSAGTGGAVMWRLFKAWIPMLTGR